MTLNSAIWKSLFPREKLRRKKPTSLGIRDSAMREVISSQPAPSAEVSVTAVQSPRFELQEMPAWLCSLAVRDLNPSPGLLLQKDPLPLPSTPKAGRCFSRDHLCVSQHFCSVLQDLFVILSVFSRSDINKRGFCFMAGSQLIQPRVSQRGKPHL